MPPLCFSCAILYTISYLIASSFAKFARFYRKISYSSIFLHLFGKVFVIFEISGILFLQTSLKRAKKFTSLFQNPLEMHANICYNTLLC